MRWNSEKDLVGVFFFKLRRKKIDGNNKSWFFFFLFFVFNFEGDDNEFIFWLRRNMFLFLFCSNLVICFLDICVMLGGLMGEKKNIEKKWLWKLFNRG